MNWVTPIPGLHPRGLKTMTHSILARAERALDNPTALVLVGLGMALAIAFFRRGA